MIVITGPTAGGKTDLSVSLAKYVNGEIINADSIQVYKDLDIGSAKIRPQEMKGIPHHLIDILDPQEPFDVVRFQKLARQAADDILSRGKVPILTGGTGFYIQAVLYDVDFSEADTDSEFRAELERIAEEKGNEAVYEILLKEDPKAAESIPAGNLRKVIRALEFKKASGRSITEHNEEQRQKKAVYDPTIFVLNMERSRLYDRINSRVDSMMKAGLYEEVQGLYNRGLRKGMTSMQAIGYKELIDCIEGRCSLDEATAQIKTATRHFAKRQLTWFRRERNINWINKDDYRDDQEIISAMLKMLPDSIAVID